MNAASPRTRRARGNRFPISSRRFFVILAERVPLSVRRFAFVLFVVGAAGAQSASAGEKVSYASNGDIVLQASSAKTHVGKWTVAADKTAAGGAVMRQKNAGAKKVYVAATKPANYFEMTFEAAAGEPHRPWGAGGAGRGF